MLEQVVCRVTTVLLTITEAHFKVRHRTLVITWRNFDVCRSVQRDTAYYLLYEGWNFNSGNYLFTADTK